MFKNVLAGPFKTTINLNDEEIQLLVKYFENSNHQVRYGEFCQMIHNEIDLNKSKYMYIIYFSLHVYSKYYILYIVLIY